MRKLALAGASFVTVMLISGCIYRIDDPPASADPSGVADSTGESIPDAAQSKGVIEVGRIGIAPVRKTSDGGSEPKMDDDDIPTNILLETCESSPTEVAVPLNAGDGKFCDTLQVYPYREDENGVYGVTAAIEWQLPADGVASFDGPAYGPGGCVRRLSALTDALWADDTWDEPETLLTVCAKPPANMPHAFAPICRSLPVRATINLEGAWCFSGATFEGDCQDVKIKQDGRLLYIDDDGLSDGRLWVRSVTFNRDNDYLYEGTVEANEYLYGIVRLNGRQEVLGTWTAWKLPLY